MAMVGRMMNHMRRRKIFKYSLGLRCLNSTLITHSYLSLSSLCPLCLRGFSLRKSPQRHRGGTELKITTLPAPSLPLPNHQKALSRRVESRSAIHDATLPSGPFLSKPYQDGSDKTPSASRSTLAPRLR